MNYKEKLIFISKCLTIDINERNKTEVENILKNKTIDWESIVKISTRQYVLPTMYCKLNKEEFLKYLPVDLIQFMHELTEINRNRNNLIIKQAHDLNNILRKHKIIPVFIKGTGNLLEGLYNNLAERMVGDIDLIVCEKDYEKTSEILSNNGYSLVSDVNQLPNFKHYPRLKKEGNIAAVEIHKELVSDKYSDEFNYNFIENGIRSVGGISLLNYEHKLVLSIISNMIEDYGLHYKNIFLRNAYDVLLFSRKINTKNLIRKHIRLKHLLNCFVATLNIYFGKMDSLAFYNTVEAQSFLKSMNCILTNNGYRKVYNALKYTELLIIKSFRFLLKCFIKKEYRIWLLNKLFCNNFSKI